MTPEQKNYCDGCYHLQHTGTESICGYIANTGKRRGGPIGEGCPRHTRKAQSEPAARPGCKIVDDQAQKMYDEGHTDKEIAKVFGVTAAAIAQWRKKRGLPSKYDPRGGEKKEKENPYMKKLMERETEDAAAEAEAAMEERAAERALQESPVEPPAPVKPRPAGNIRMEPRPEPEPPKEPAQKGWPFYDFSMAQRCIGVIEGVAEGITLNPGAKGRLLQAARTLCELLEANQK